MLLHCEEARGKLKAALWSLVSQLSLAVSISRTDVLVDGQTFLDSTLSPRAYS